MTAFEDGVCGFKREQWIHGRQGGKHRETAPPACGELPESGAEVESHDA